MLEQLAAVRDKVLDRADLRPGETLLDVGCGNGLIGFGALERGAARSCSPTCLARSSMTAARWLRRQG